MWEEGHGPDGEDRRLGLAVSGGPDSLALLVLAHAALPGRIEVASVDHGLRAESASEAAFVAQVCETLDIPCGVLTVDVGPGNLQDRARQARYDALAQHFASRGIDAIATAHHADDQAETVLMRLNRGSGLAGLAGIRARSVRPLPSGAQEYLVVRPLLHWRRDELAGIVAECGLTPVRDPSNEDERFDRVQVRKALAGLPWLDPLAIAMSARNLQDAEPVIEDAVAQAWRDCVHRQDADRDDGIVWFEFDHPRAVEIEVVQRILRSFGASARGSATARLVERLYAHGAGSLGGVAAKRALYSGAPGDSVDAWKFEREPPRRTE
ncbi:tRNA lysidine(34) synthetase TilS [Altererythrobacter sp. MTPC7]|uniref:tRNA lysidine(34) synthetase TilS n=1 Tax=Altererythrobacter sp. MTPC7 TaxID=3056567 RepID=UPI0036F1EF15